MDNVHTHEAHVCPVLAIHFHSHVCGTDMGMYSLARRILLELHSPKLGTSHRGRLRTQRVECSLACGTECQVRRERSGVLAAEYPWSHFYYRSDRKIGRGREQRRRRWGAPRAMLLAGAPLAAPEVQALRREPRTA